MSPVELQPYDTAEFLQDEAECIALLNRALAGDEPRVVASVVGAIARWKGMAQVAEETGLSRESLYKALSINGNPTLDTLMRVLKALGIRLRCELIPETEAEPNSEAKEAVPA